MIFEVFQILTEQVNHYFQQVGLDDSVVIMDNIALSDAPTDESDAMKDKVVLSLVNLMEESTLKNFPNHKRTQDQVQYRNRVIHMHLFLLFSANRNAYGKSLKDLSAIIEFFQGKMLFTQSNTIYNRDLNSMQDVGDFRFTMEIYTPTFEELNFLWGTLGGKQLPSVLYKLNLLPLERNLEQAESGLVQRVSSNMKKMPDHD